MVSTQAEGDSAQELLQAQSYIYHQILQHAGTMSLKCAVQLGIFDTIHGIGRPVTLPELLSALPINPKKASCMHRLMRILAQMGYFVVQKEGSAGGEDAYSLTVFSRILLKDSPSSLASWVVGAQHPLLLDPWQDMLAWLQHEQATSLFEMHHGKSFWDMVKEQPDFGSLFNQAMSDDSRTWSKMVTNCKEAFKGLRSLVDVGGGDGTMARAIAETFPHIKCTAYDLPHVIPTVPEGSLVEAVGGNMFEYVPSADAVFLKMILHDWNDENSVKILKMCKKAIAGKVGGKVMIVDIVLSAENDDSKLKELKIYFDMSLMVVSDGKEREEQDWKKIFTDAGFTDYKITPLGLHSLIEVFP